MAKELIEKLKREITGFREEIRAEKIGRVIETADGVLRIRGLSETASQEMLEIETVEGVIQALALNLEEDAIGAVILGEARTVKENDIVRRSGRVLSVPVGRELIGRVVGPLMEPLDAKGSIFSDVASAPRYSLEKIAPDVMARNPVSTPLHTGITAIDAMMPIGRGQRQLIIGDRQTGKTALAIDAILNQAQDIGRKTPICIYVSIGQRESKTRKIAEKLELKGAMRYTIIVSASASAPAPLQYIAPYAACALGEYFMEKGEDVLIIYDDLTKHANAWREVSLLLRRPPGREAYPGDIFYAHARLLERAANMAQEHGGGSLTAFPIIETQLDDISAYIPTNVISITDGQIYLQTDLFRRGIRPAINPGLSVSRVGSAAQTKAMKKVASRLRLDLAQFRELETFTQFSAELDESTRQRITRGMVITELLGQDEASPLPIHAQTLMLWAGVYGHFDSIPTPSIKSTATAWITYLETMHGAVIKDITAEEDISPETEKKLNSAMETFRTSFQ